MKRCKILIKNKNELNVMVADNFFTRFRGLIARNIMKNEGMLLSPCNQIHCFFMSYPIDVIYISDKWIVIKVDKSMMPGSIGRRVKNCRYVLELPAGISSENGIVMGDKLHLFNMEG